MSVIEKRGYYTGYSSDGVTISYENNNLIISNNSPRRFAEIAFYADGKGYLTNYTILPFSRLSIRIPDHFNLTDGEKFFLDPASAFRPNVSQFKKNVINLDDETQLRYFKNYGLIISHMKNFYAQNKTKQNFFDYFLKVRRESLDSTLSKWYRTNTYDTPNVYYVDKRSGDIFGSASPGSLSLNFSNFHLSVVYKKYGTYSHERAHTMGYDHSSGLANHWNWDRYVRSGIGTLLENQPITESSKVYLYYDQDTNKIYALELRTF